MPRRGRGGGSIKERKRIGRAIINKWNERHSMFIRFIDGDRNNHELTNMALALIPDLLENFDVWTIDWDVDLTEEEIALVRNANWRAGLHFKNR